MMICEWWASWDCEISCESVCMTFGDSLVGLWKWGSWGSDLLHSFSIDNLQEAGFLWAYCGGGLLQKCLVDCGCSKVFVVAYPGFYVLWKPRRGVQSRVFIDGPQGNLSHVDPVWQHSMDDPLRVGSPWRC